MIKCTECGNEVEEGYKFCPSCGSEIPTFKNCVKCGTKLTIKMAFCHECGAPQNQKSLSDEIKNTKESVIAGKTENKVENKAEVCSCCGREIDKTASYTCQECGKLVCYYCFIPTKEKRCKTCEGKHYFQLGTSTAVCSVNSYGQSIYTFEEYGGNRGSAIEEASDNLIKASKFGYVPAYSLVSDYYHYWVDTHEECNTDREKYLYFKYNKKGAEVGNLDCLYKLGKCYYDGFGVAENKIKYYELLKEAAEKGYARAQYDLGIEYLRISGDLGRDFTKARMWLEKAFHNGCREALGLIYENISQELEYLLGIDSTDSCDGKTLYDLGCLYCYDVKYIYKSVWCYSETTVSGYYEIKDYFYKSAELGYGPANFYCGLASSSIDEKIQYYKKGADLGDLRCLFALGLLYTAKGTDTFGNFGKTEIIDEKKAFTLISEAADKGLPEAQFFLGLNYLGGTGAYYEDALGDVSYFLETNMVTKNINLAYTYLKKAFSNGFIAAKYYPRVGGVYTV